MRKISLVKIYVFDKLHLKKDLIECKLYQIIDQLNEGKNIPVKLYSILSNKIHLLYDGNGRT